ncbi:MAG: LytTR family DNA-binding domain-containing protein [Bacteroidota bacterium]
MSKPLRVAIIDDEADARALVKIHLERHPHVQLVGEASDGEMAVALIEEKQPDLIFLDIQMPAFDGLEVISKSSYIPQVIFITAYDSYAIKAFELNAVDYLLKPFTPERFDAAMERASERLQTSLDNEVLRRIARQLQQNGAEQPYLKHLVHRRSSTTEYIPVEDILFIRAADQYVEAHTLEQSYLLRQSMDSLEQQLDPALFFRTHRSAIIALDQLKAISQDEFKHYQVVLKGGQVVPLSQVRRAMLVANL